MQHPSGIPEKIVKKVIARRGRLHVFETIDPKTTTFYRIFGDVRPSEEIIRLLE